MFEILSAGTDIGHRASYPLWINAKLWTSRPRPTRIVTGLVFELPGSSSGRADPHRHRATLHLCG
ncbi:hypothetical protein MXEN_03384 [Mycobacterium xenopi RIVM700367]|uniref:Uncharacterized protein n=1 Tax=Mycobacterium xenopi 4042 TaxID=1299334 RepID=X8CDQ8_MYCXE|nr:hypothetical protein MXEN_03384 [Mycobacterium xenopi RIVM700367]EUA34363.1 hypothetical protein I552_5146 [Mycobacterium xenopi 3993]EUA54517.1 hypothetical protein I553_1337 [Mycobacterium xenopi 4042]ORX15844.1 hypothetical protein AWC32_13570 [Mycobacterium xenopi]